MSWTQNRHPRDPNSTQTPVQSPLHQFQQPKLHQNPPTADPGANNYNVNTQWNNYNQTVQQAAQVNEVIGFVQQPNATSNNSASWPQQNIEYANKGITSGVSAVQPVSYFASQQQTADNFLQQPLIPPHATYQQTVSPLSQALPLTQGQNSNNIVSGNVIKSQQTSEFHPSQKNVLSKPDQYNNNNNNNNGQGGTDWDDWNDWNENNTLAPLNADQPSLKNPQQNFIEDSFNTELSDNWQFGNNSVGLTNLSKNNHSQLPNESSTIANLRTNNGKSGIEQVKPMVSGAPNLGNESSSNFVPNVHQIHSNSVNLMSITSNAATLGVSHDGISSVPETTGLENISGEYFLQTKPVAKPPGQFANPTTAEKIASTPPQLSQHSLPPSSHTSTSAGNPFKRSVTSHQHRSLSGNHSIQQQTNVMPFFVSPPPPPLDFANSTDNQEILSVENLEVIDQPSGIENNDVIPNKDRNQYLQTSHLSEEGLSRNSEINSAQETNTELDTFPPPGLSRLVLGQPESTQNPPHGLDRMIPGTELDSDLNLVRQADGQDTVPISRSAFSSADNRNNVTSSNIDFTSDRNLYLVPGDSGINEPQQLRVVTGLENNSHGQPSMVMPSLPSMVDTVQTEQREVELDGENLEDAPLVASAEQQHRQQQQQQHQQQHQEHQYQYQQQQEHHQQLNIHQTNNLPLNQQLNTTDQIEVLLSSREEPIEGGNTMDNPSLIKQSAGQPNNPVVSLESNPSKDLSNLSTEIDESDQEQFKRHSNYYSKSNRLGDDKKKRPLTSTDEQRRDRRYDSEESDYSSERENRRYRENSVKDDRNKDRDSKERKRSEKYATDRVKSDLRTKDRYRDEKDRYDRNSDYRGSVRRDKYEKDRSSRYGGGSKYDTDLKYETESSIKNERRIRPDRERDRDRDRKREDEGDRYNDPRRDSERDRRHNRKDRRDGRDEREKDRDRDRARGYRDRNYPDDRENRRSIRDKKHSDYEDAYRKTSSRNARESDLERDRKDSRFPSSQIYGSGYQSNSYGYDPYALYQQQQYYEHLRRTNPQAYAEWYRKYYSQMQQDSLTTDGRESVHSGRSSANNEKNRYSVQQQHHQHQYIAHQIPQSNISMNLNSTMIDQQQYVGSGIVRGSYGLGHGQSTGNLSQIGQIPGGYYGGTSGRSYYARSEYSETRTDNMSLNLIDGSGIGASSIQESARLTPCKFNNSHSVVSLSSGLLVSVKPKYSVNGTANIVKMLKFAPNDSTRRLFQSFPGPLIRGLTHKRTVIEFCEEQIRLGPSSTILRSRQNSMNSLCSSVSQANKASYCLMWNLLILLLHQNGMIVGTDIAELLMKNKSAYPYEAPNSALGSKCPGSRRESVQSNEFTEKVATAGSDIEIESTSAVDSNKTNRSELEEQDVAIPSTTLLTEQKITEKFRNYLLYGNVNEALEWATENNLWGHALFLASKVDRRSHANVMMKFANKLSLNDPLQTLYQLMSGRMPSSVTSIQDEKWGDWRTHLAMILSNTSQKPELDQKSITTLGDSLYNRGDLFGAHFCYLMAQVGFGNYSDASTETTTLLTKSSNAVRLVLLGSSHQKQFKEFATNEAIMMTEIYEYACSLNDDKFSIVQFQPYKYLLATRMLDYGYHLKCLMYMEQIALHIQRDPAKYEPSFIEKIFKMADRLKYYDPILEKHEDDQEHLDNSTSVPDQKWLQGLYGIVQEYAGNLNSQINQQPQYQPTITEDPSQISEINNEFSEINRQFNELNLQYTNYAPSQSLGSVPQTLPELATDNQYMSPQSAVTQVVPSYNSENYYQPNDLSNKTHQQVATTSTELSSNNYLQPANVLQQQNMYTYGNSNQETAQQSTYEYMPSDQQWQQPLPFNNETQKQQISLPNSKIGYDDNSGKDSSASGIGGDSKKSQTQMKKSEQKQQSGKVDANQKLGGGGGNNEAGWFGGIWNKLSLKPKNQMILPDDKNPSIVWDQENKCWVNTEGGDEAENSFKPPPKMSDIMSQPNINYNEVPQQFASHTHQEQSMSAPLSGMIPTNNPNQNYSASMATGHNIPPTAAGGEITKTPSLQSNKFKMQRNRTLKNSYVDVFNPPGAQPSKQTEAVLAPAMTTAAVPQSGFFIPSAPDNSSSQNQQQQQQQQQQDSAVPQFYNPNQYGGYQK